MGENYHSDMGGPEDQRLSSLRSSLISPNAAYLAQQQQWNQGDHSSSWNITDDDFGFNNQHPHYQQRQQQQWIIDQYAPSDAQSFMPQNSYWGGYEPQGQQMLGSSDYDAMVMDQANAGLQSNNNKVGNEGYEASNNHPSSKHHSANHGARENDNLQGKTPPTEHELQMKRAAAIASLQKHTASAGASGNESTPPRGTPPQNAAQVATTAKEGKYSETQRALFQTGDKTKTKREPTSADRSSPIERTTKLQSKQSFTDGKVGPSVLETPSNGSSHYRKRDDGEAKKDTTHRASSTDIDGLLAEGRAAAEASQKSETNGNGKDLASPKLGVHQKVGSRKEPDTEVGSYRRNSLASRRSSDPSEMGEIRDEPHQHLTSQSKLKEKGAIPASSKDLDVGPSKSHSSRPSNGLSRNPTTKTDTSIDNKESKQTTNQLGDSEKRRFGCDSRAPKDVDSTPRTSRHNSSQSSQPRGEKHSVSKSEPRSAEKLKKPQGLHSRPDRPIYEPTRHPSRYKAADQPSKEPMEKNESDRAPTTGHQYPKATDTRTPRDSQKSAVEDTKPGFDNSFAHLSALEVEELREWLIVTGYHDEAFRRKTMQRHRRLAVLEQERAELLKEEQEERGALTNARSKSFVSPDAPAVPGTPSLSFSATMPPPQSLNKNDDSPKPFISSGGRIGASNSVADGSPARNDSRASRTPLLKRRLSASAGLDSDIKPVEKVARTDLVTESPNNKDRSQDRHREFSGSRRDRDARDGEQDGNVKLTKGKLTMDGMNEERREALSRHRSSDDMSPNGREKENDRQNRYSYESNRMRREWSESSEYKDYGPAPSRGRGRGRFHRGSHRGTPFFKPHRSERKGDGNDLDLRLGDVQYFMVKSWTYDNVEISQREGTWATQVKNMDKFAQAYEECRHVILLFSVNNSKAFQGYARMESCLGAPGVRAPSWAEDLVWEPSPPFKIRWITINETRFRYVGHLKNSYNEDEPVLVGRDGQEIEPRCGQDLCEILDNENPNTQANPSWVKPHKPMSNKTW